MMADSFVYSQPFEAGTLGSQCFRIPTLCTLLDGSVMAGTDVRYAHGADSPNNIDIAVAVSANGRTDWQYTVVNHFDDYADDTTDKDSASFIDSAIAQTANGRIFLITDVFPSQGGYLQAKKGTGFARIDGKKRMLLTSGNNGDKLASFGFYIGDFEGDTAPVLGRNDNQKTAYSVDREFRLYKNGSPLCCPQKGTEGVQVQQNVFYSAAELQVYRTVYLWLRTSDDNGKTWSAPTVLSDSLKFDNESFFGICPGRGTVIRHNGKERILFCVYNNRGIITDPISENACAIYSDDNGLTWHRSQKIKVSRVLTKTSESQIVELESNGQKRLRMYARNNSNFIAFSDSTDGGETWTAFRPDMALQGTRNCMVSFISTSRRLDGKQVILCSAGGSVTARADGVLRVGVVGDGFCVRWLPPYHVNNGFFAYSCLTELPDGNFALLYEGMSAALQYMLFSVAADGTIHALDGKDCVFEEKPLSMLQKLRFCVKKLAVSVAAK